MQYIGNSSNGGLLPYWESSLAARSKASGCWRMLRNLGELLLVVDLLTDAHRMCLCMSRNARREY
jgi:hypothetical protein